jgi:hypothetical protein
MTTSDHSTHNFTKYADLPSIGRLSLANTTNNATVLEPFSKYLICGDNQLNWFGIKLPSYITSPQRIYPSQLSVFCLCLIELLEHLNTFNLHETTYKISARRGANSNINFCNPAENNAINYKDPEINNCEFNKIILQTLCHHFFH